MKRRYILMDCGADFEANNLFDIKDHIRMMSDRDKQDMEGVPVVGYNHKGKEVYYRVVRFKNGGIVFSRK